MISGEIEQVGAVGMDLVIDDRIEPQIEKLAGKALKTSEQRFKVVGKAISDSVRKPLGGIDKKLSESMVEASKKAAQASSGHIRASFEEAEKSLDELIAKCVKPMEIDVDVKQSAKQQYSPKPLDKGETWDGYVEKKGLGAGESRASKPEKKYSAPDFSVATDTVGLLNQKLDITYAQMGAVEKQLGEVTREYEQLANSNGFGDAKVKKLEQSMTSLQSKLISLQSTANGTEAKLTKAMEAPAKEAQKATMVIERAQAKAAAAAQRAQNKAADVAQRAQERMAKAAQQAQSKAATAAQRTSRSIIAGTNKTKRHTLQSYGAIGKGAHKLGRSIKSAIKSAFLMASLYAFFRAFKDHMGKALTQNKQFAASLNAVKANLAVAFTPIIQAVMPTLNKLMSGLATATQYIAVFTSKLFGKTYQQSIAATKAISKTADKAKEAAASTLASFDKIDVLEQPKAEKEEDGGIDYDKLADFASVDAKVDEFITRTKNKLKELGGTDFFSTLRGGWNEFAKQAGACDFKTPLKSALENAVGVVFSSGTLLAKATLPIAIGLNIPKTVETGLKLLSTVLGNVKKIIDSITPGVEKFVTIGLKPMAEWLGDKLRDGMEFFGKQWDKIGKWFEDHKETLTKAGEELGKLTSTIWSLIEPLLSQAWKTAKEHISTLINVVLDLAGMWIDYFTKCITAINKFIAAVKKFVTNIGDKMAELKDKVVGKFNEIKTNITKKCAEIKNNISSKFTEAKTAVINIATGLKDKVVGCFTTVRDKAANALTSLKDKIKSIWDNIWSSTKGFINKFLGGIENMINKPVTAINKLIGMVNKLPKIELPQFLGGGTLGFSLPTISPVSIPRLAKGGIATQPTLAMIGDNRRASVDPEVVSPLSKLKGMLAESGTTGEVVDLLKMIIELLSMIKDQESVLRLEGNMAQFIRLLKAEIRKDDKRAGISKIKGGI